MKLTKFLSVAVIAILSLSISSCNKEADPIILTGSWQLDPSATFLQIIYNPTYAEMYPSAIQYLKDNKEKILTEIKKPDIIQFSDPNVVDFIYTSPLAPTVTGTFDQFEIYVNIKNALFPTGIAGASNNHKLEIYYTKDYMMSILYSILTPEDDSQDTFSKLIEQFDGVGVYVRAQ
ncbi:MAG: hypothetical protein WCX48_00195 [Bacteroidales bacterium]